MRGTYTPLHCNNGEGMFYLTCYSNYSLNRKGMSHIIYMYSLYITVALNITRSL